MKMTTNRVKEDGRASATRGRRRVETAVHATGHDPHRLPARMKAGTTSSGVLRAYFLLTFAVLLLNTAGYLSHIAYDGVWVSVFAVAVYVAYTSFYIAPVLLLVFGVRRFVTTRPFRRCFRDRERLARGIVYVVAVASSAFLQYLIFADKSVFSVFGFHLNGFVWNLVLTPGGIDSMGGGSSTMLLACLIGVVFALVQAVLLLLAIKVAAVRKLAARWFSRRSVIIGVGAVILVVAAAQIGYGISSLRNYGPVMNAAEVFPCFVPTTFSNLASSLGYEVERAPTMAGASESTMLQYPLRPIVRDDAVKPPNIVWLVTESLRADMLDPEIMPHTWKLSERSSRFEHHYSGGNGTRMGMFSMFYGLYGPYWFSFLAERRGPVLVDTLFDLNYQMEMYTSAMFSYPEFDKTLFTRVSSDHLHQGGGKPAWRQDQRHINSMLRFIEQRDPSRPFFTFMFFESPHANYAFSKDAIIRRPYANEINYVSMDLERDIALIKNRYINSCHQMDIQIGRIVDFLTGHDLMDSTVVLITGDHGEEFMEKGRWGHNSEFTEEQTLAPLVLWVPGKPARVVKRITSHLDIPATILPLLGVLNPAQDYSLGHDLFGPERREFTVISAWNHVAYVDEHFKATFPTSAFAMFRQTVTTANDEPVADRTSFYKQHQQNIVKVMRGLKAFRK